MSRWTMDEIESPVQEFRSSHGLGNEEPIKIKSFLQKNGILTVYKPLGGSFSGMAIKTSGSDGIKRFILVNSEHSIGKQHFTICHELYHLFIQKEFSSEIGSAGKFDKKGNPEEYKADLFAACLLLPKYGVFKMIPEEERKKNKISLPTLVAIEQYYGCSRSALLYRLMNMDLLDDECMSNFNKGITPLAKQLGYDISLYQKGNRNVVVGDYGTLAYRAWCKGIISESSYYSFLEDLGINVAGLDTLNIVTDGEED